jgi:hypothetical protein
VPAATSESIIYCSPELRALWPSPLAAQWAEQYPQLFDVDDIRITRHQPRNHFAEWLAAIYLFHRDGALSLVEKYLFGSHLRKQALVRELLTEDQRAVLDSIRAEFRAQPPDILVFTPDRRQFWFAEVKGPGDRVRDVQRRSHTAIRERLGVPVELVTVRCFNTKPPNRVGPTARCTATAIRAQLDPNASLQFSPISPH